MHIISRRTHGILDYVIGVLLIFSPQIFGFASAGAESRLPVILGIATLIYSLLTNYELGLWKVLPFRTHLGLDTFSGLLLALSPWLFQFDDRVWVPHLILGGVEIGAVLLTQSAGSETHPGAPSRPAQM